MADELLPSFYEAFFGAKSSEFLDVEIFVTGLSILYHSDIIEKRTRLFKVYFVQLLLTFLL